MNALPATTPDMSPERLAAARRWIQLGRHNSSDVAEAVARRILERGDLRAERRDDRGQDDHIVH